MRFRALGAVLLGLMSTGLSSASGVTGGPGAHQVEVARSVPAGGGSSAPALRHRTPSRAVEGCFEPPPEPAAVFPCADPPVTP